MDNLVSLSARDDLLWIVAQWPALTARLRPGGGNGLTGMPRAKSKPLPIDVHVSDLMADIESKVARFYGRILMDETEWTPTSSTMPALLKDVAMRYGHFTSEDDEMARGFCDDANDYRHKVRKALEPRTPPTYIGPCQGDNCDGELYIRDDRENGTCPACGSDFTLVGQREYLKAELANRLMTPAEIVRGLKHAGHDIKAATVYKWVQREKIKPVEPDVNLYKFLDALTLAERRVTLTNRSVH